jgi:CRISPR-associated protein (TIGR03986 family)
MIDIITDHLNGSDRDAVINTTLSFSVSNKINNKICHSFTLCFDNFEERGKRVELYDLLFDHRNITPNSINISGSIAEDFFRNLTINWKCLDLTTKRELIALSSLANERCIYNGSWLIKWDHSSEDWGYLICSDKGQINGNKLSETFFNPPGELGFTIEPEAMKRFAWLHSKFGRNHWKPDGTWAYWLEHMGYPDPLSGETKHPSPPNPGGLPGIPVFFCGRPAEINNQDAQKCFLGFSRVIKIPYKYSLGEIAARTTEPNSGGVYRIPPLRGKIDMARAMFGDVEGSLPGEGLQARQGTQEDRQGLKGRVAFGFAQRQDGTCQEGPVERTVMMAPRASYWPFYLKDATDPSRSAKYNRSEAILAGRKRYPVSEYTEPLPRENRQNNDLNTQVVFLQCTAQKKPVFTGRIRFHNLHPVELGALLWALCLGDPGGTRNLCHALGRAKGFGYGRMSCRMIGFLATENFTGHTKTDSMFFLGKFQEYMDGKLSELGYRFPLQDSPAVKALQAMADPYKATGQALGQMESPTVFGKLKKDSTTLPLYKDQASQDWTAMRPNYRETKQQTDASSR